MEIKSSLERESQKFNVGAQQLAMFSLKAPEQKKLEEQEIKAPIDICCVIDKSGSMAGAKLELVKKALLFVLDNLSSSDSLSVVVYDSNVEVLLPFSRMSPLEKERARTLIEHIKDGSSTNLAGGLLKGLDLIREREVDQKNEVCSLLLFTDGLANEGITQSSQITAAMIPKMEGEKGTVFTFGFGGDHDQIMLRALAETGGGMYYFIEDVDGIPVSFADCLGGLQTVVGQNLSLKISPLEGTTLLKSLNAKYKITSGSLPCQEPNSITLQLNDVYSEESRDIIFLLELASLPEPKPEIHPCGRFSLQYYDVNDLGDKVLELDLMVSRPAEEDLSIQPNMALDKQRNRLRAAEAMESSRSMADRGDLSNAKILIEEAKKGILGSVSGGDEFCLKLVKELDQCLEDMRNQEHYRIEGSKKMMRKEQAHYYQRSNRIVDEEEDFYETSSKAAYKMRSKGN